MMSRVLLHLLDEDVPYIYIYIYNVRFREQNSSHFVFYAAEIIPPRRKSLPRGVTCHVPGCRLANYCTLATNFSRNVGICSLFSPSRRLRPTMAGNPWVIKAWADDIGAPISEEDATKVIGTSFHGRYRMISASLVLVRDRLQEGGSW